MSFYNNDVAGKIYHNIGYKEINEWTILLNRYKIKTLSRIKVFINNYIFTIIHDRVFLNL